MNSLDDFARLRPDVDAATAGELEDLWNDVVVDDIERSRRDAQRPVRRRRLAFIGAAAVLGLGVVAIASFADRAEAPPSMSESSLVDPSAPPTPPMSSVSVPGWDIGGSIEAGEPPLWGVVEEGWSLAEYSDHSDGPLDTVRLYAGPNGLATSWVAVVSGMSEPLAPIGFEPDDPETGPSPISTQRIATEAGSMAVIAGGVSDVQAMAVFSAVRDGGAPPDGFVETDSAEAAVRTIRYRFVNEMGEWIDVEVQGAGVPRYEVERSAATAEEGWDSTAGVDESSIAYAGQYTLLLRNGFWVSRVITSAPSDSPTTFTRLASLVQPVSLDQWDEAQPVATSVPARLAIGDSVMLGAAGSLLDRGFVVDAAESRAFVHGLDVVATLGETSRLPDTMVVHLGSNGPIGDERMADFVDLVADVDTVLFLTNAIDRDYTARNNELIFDAAAAHSNIAVLDWAGFAAECPGDCFEADGFHLKPDGRDFYAALIAESVSN